MRKGIFALVFLLAAAAAFGQTKPVLGILPFTGGTGEDGEMTANLFASSGILSREFRLVPRTSGIDAAVTGEQKFQRAGITDSDTIVGLGKEMGAAYVIAGHIARLGNGNLLVISIIDVEKMEQIAGAHREYAAIEDIRRLLPDMAAAIVTSVQGQGAAASGALAVMPLDIQDPAVEQNDAELLARILAAEIANTRHYRVLSRTRQIGAIINEQKYQRLGLTALETIAAVGEAANAQYVLAGRITRLGSMNLFDVEILDAATGEQIISSRREYRDLTDGVEIMRSLALDVTGAAEAVPVLEYTVSSDSEFTQAVAGINASATPGIYRINLTGDIRADRISFSSPAPGKTIIIRGDTIPRTIYNADDADLFTVSPGVALVLENNVTLDGNEKEGGLAYVDEGTLIMKAGSSIKGAKKGGVSVFHGVFTLEGGEISGNTASLGGGGVNITSYSRFTMSGGKISENTASLGAGGVDITSNSVFTMSGGEISGNTAFLGAGVYINGGTFTMSGGEIIRNTAPSGGGVYISDGVFTMSGGKIRGNTASHYSGGGVDLNNNSAFTMSGGEISGNMASYGGGVYVESSRFIKKGGGTITGSNRAAKGRAVYVDSLDSPQMWRNSTAGPDLDMDSNITGSEGGWEQ
jgi:TolB-like protein